jgi:predicted PurR-regulated permease PerM
MSEELTPPGPPADQDEMWHRYRKYPYLLAKLTFYAVLVVLTYVLVGAAGSVVFPLFLSMLAAYLLDPFIDRFEERGVSRTAAILVVIVGAGLGMSVFVAFLYPLLAKQIITIIEKFPTLLDSLQNDFIPWAQRTLPVELPPTLSEAAAEYGEDIKSAAPAVLRKVGDYATGLVTQTGVVIASLLNIVMIPIFTFYFLRDFDDMRLAAAEYVPEYSRDVVFDRLRRIDDVVGAWFRGQIQVGLILAVLYGIGLGVSFKITGHSAFDGVALGVITGVLNVIPYVGFVVGAVLSVLVVLIEWTGFGSVVGVIIVFAVVQGLEGYVITPKIVGEKVGLSPVTVIIVLLVGGEVAGLLGVLLAIPVAGAIKVIIPDLLEAYTRSAYYRGVRRKEPAGSAPGGEGDGVEAEEADAEAETEPAAEGASAPEDPAPEEPAPEDAPARAEAEEPEEPEEPAALAQAPREGPGDDPEGAAEGVAEGAQEEQ